MIVDQAAFVSRYISDNLPQVSEGYNLTHDSDTKRRVDHNYLFSIRLFWICLTFYLILVAVAYYV